MLFPHNQVSTLQEAIFDLESFCDGEMKMVFKFCDLENFKFHHTFVEYLENDFEKLSINIFFIPIPLLI